MNRQYQGQNQGQGPPGGSSGLASRPIELSIEKLPGSHPFIFKNLCAVSPSDFQSPDGGLVYVMLKNAGREYVVTASPLPDWPRGKISLADHQRTWTSLALRDEFLGQAYDPFTKGKNVYLGTMDLEIGFARPSRTTDTPYDQDELASKIVQEFQNHMFTPGQKFVMDVANIPLALTVKAVQLIDLTMEKSQAASLPSTSDPNARGIVANFTTVNLYKDQSPIKLKGSATRPPTNAIIRPDFKFEDMGIGGLDEEFSTIFRRAFVSRLVPPGLLEQMGMNHVKGMLLYGPPGTGKTLIAREIGKMLNARPPKIINGPEVLNKFVGQSEENIRKMFADAEKEYKEKGEESGLHIIIFDELDAVCKQRGTSSGGTGVGDNIVNQLLTKLDGVEQLNNILLIGMTNRKDLIDEALLRPGRLEVHVEISLPDEPGRLQILKIHTSKIRNNNKLGDDVNLEEIAALTKNYSGAELLGVVRAASSYAFNRQIAMNGRTGPGGVAAPQGSFDNTKIMRDDFMEALNEVKSAFGVSGDELAEAIPKGIIPFSPATEEIRQVGRNYASVLADPRSSRVWSLLLHGARDAGKTALAADIAIASGAPFIRIVNPRQLIGMTEQAKIAYLQRLFQDAYKSPISVVILDEVEAMIEYNPVGYKYQNGILNTIGVLMKGVPPKGHGILVITTSRRQEILQQLETLTFNKEIQVPVVTDLDQLRIVLQSIETFPQGDIEEVLNSLYSATGSAKVGVGIAQILREVDVALVEAQNNGVSVGRALAGALVGLVQ
ncbi:P-loop containing nucleoside triphosphate hydrolase protein [Xylariales sp. PMI_506]|nr:P-loop containing nucleoside triphosphate hydrolase protein [Xylariales sp. PMI_506]